MVAVRTALVAVKLAELVAVTVQDAGPEAPKVVVLIYSTVSAATDAVKLEMPEHATVYPTRKKDRDQR